MYGLDDEKLLRRVRPKTLLWRESRAGLSHFYIEISITPQFEPHFFNQISHGLVKRELSTYYYLETSRYRAPTVYMKITTHEAGPS